MLSQYRLRVKLHTLNLFRAMPQAHNEPVGRAGRDLKTIRHIFAFDDQRMIAPGGECLRQPVKYGLSVMADLDRLSMHWLRGSRDLAAKMLADGLMAQTNPKYRQSIRKPVDRTQRYARRIRRARPRRDQYSLRFEFMLNLVDANLVIAEDLTKRPELA